MRYRKKIKKGRSNRIFKKTVRKHRVNKNPRYKGIKRGGTRL